VRRGAGTPGLSQENAGARPATPWRRAKALHTRNNIKPGLGQAREGSSCPRRDTHERLPWRPDCRHIEVSTTHSIVLRVHLPEVLVRWRKDANCILPPSQKACMRSVWQSLPDQPEPGWTRQGTQVFAGNEGASRRAGRKPQGHLAPLPFTWGYGQAHWAVNAR
jgi:hypothetical protein